MAKEQDVPVHNSQEVQGSEDRHGPKYDNDVPVDSWLRSNGEKKPGFDKKGR